jgi:hypothetical protein
MPMSPNQAWANVCTTIQAKIRELQAQPSLQRFYREELVLWQSLLRWVASLGHPLHISFPALYYVRYRSGLVQGTRYFEGRIILHNRGRSAPGRALCHYQNVLYSRRNISGNEYYDFYWNLGRRGPHDTLLDFGALPRTGGPPNLHPIPGTNPVQYSAASLRDRNTYFAGRDISDAAVKNRVAGRAGTPSTFIIIPGAR